MSDRDDQTAFLNRRKRVAFTVAGLVSAAFLIVHCSVAPKTEIQPVSNGNGTVTCPDGSAAGTERPGQCPAGETGTVVQVCGSDGKWADEPTNSCTKPGPVTPPPACIPFSTVQPIFASGCAGCHASATAAQVAAISPKGLSEVSLRVGLDPSDSHHMPEAGHSQLTAGQVVAIQNWVAAGGKDSCDTPPPGPSTTLIRSKDWIHSAAVDALSLSTSDQPTTRYVVTAGAINAGATAADLKVWEDAINLALNSLNPSGQALVKAVKVGPGVWRVDLRNYNINAAKLAALDAADVLNIVDNTSEGKILEGLVQDKHAFWLADDLIVSAFNNSNVYYTMLNAPATVQQLEAQIGVNLAGDLGALPQVPGTSKDQISFVGAVGQITLQKNRLILRDSQIARVADGSAYYLRTFDVNDQPNNVVVGGVQVNSKNLDQNPLLAGTGAQTTDGASVHNYTQDASESIWALPNGLQAYFLADAQGNRLNAAATNVVIDTVAASEGLSEVISVGLTCAECHNSGSIALIDTTLAKVNGSTEQFSGTNDVDLVKKVYHDATTNAAMFAADQNSFLAAEAKLGIQPGPTPMNVLGNAFLRNWPLAKLAGDLGLAPPELTACINSSASSKQLIGELVTGASAPEADIAAALPQLIVDCHLFQDSI